MAEKRAINGFVLVGGKSSRMGRDKSLMPFGGMPLVLRVAEALAPLVRQVSLLGPPERYGHTGLHVIADKWPGQGPLAAICTGLVSSDAEWTIFLACDLPLVSQAFIGFLVQRAMNSESDAVVPRLADGWQPLAAAYRANCRTQFARAIEAGERSIIRAFAGMRVEAITPDEMAAAGLSETELANVNTPEDWERLRELTKGGEAT
jgi:molybdenum cofactor guanylyltransferase